MKVREDSVKATVKGISTRSFLESVKLREGSVKATVKLKVLQELVLYFQRFPECSFEVSSCVDCALRNSALDFSHIEASSRNL